MKYERFEFIPQHFPMWVREHRQPDNALAYSTYKVIIGWTWTDGPGTVLDETEPPTLHPVVVDGYGADVYNIDLCPGVEDWEITNEGPKES